MILLFLCFYACIIPFLVIAWYNTSMDIKELKITDKKIKILESMEIHSAEDLLMHYPFRYEEHKTKIFDEWIKDEKVCFEATILTPARVTRFGMKRSATRFKVLYDMIELDVTLFNRPWVSAFKVGNTISIFGKYEGNYKVTCMNYNSAPIQEQLGIIPIYSLKEGITQKDIRKYMHMALNECYMEDFIPDAYQHKYRLLHRKQALFKIHEPENKEDLKQALRTLKYEEFLKFQLQMQYMKQTNTETKGMAKHFEISKIQAFIDALPFTLTKGQNGAVQDILHDLSETQVMYRLVQGDVGCGKTLVAAIGMYACVLAKKQAAMMAPTEILARQHYHNLKQLFKDYLRVEILYSSMNKNEKAFVIESLKKGEIDILVGTHALFQEDVIYHDLGMVVTDEQHRFGVEQRRKLLEKGDKVDFLLMSATPIPRTLAVSLFGDMDVSTIEDLPSGRKTTITKYIPEDSMRQVLKEILMKVDEGEQCYIVCPAIEKNEEYKLRNVDELYQGMQQVLGKKYKIAYLHGKLSSEEKDQIMEDFKNKKYHMLIATTVIEVGVDVKDANIMVIYDAHRFGMSQIHQLRGRVGRGNRQGYCYLLSGTKDVDAMKRLQLCASISDGFELARVDLSLRGPGDLLGKRQSGVSGFLLGDIIRDDSILEVARNDALEILSNLSHFEQIHSFLMKKDYTSYLD